MTKTINPDETADTLALCLYTLMDSMQLSKDNIQSFLQNFRIIGNRIDEQELSMEEVRETLSEKGGIHLDDIYSPAEKGKREYYAKKISPVPIKELQNQIDILRGIRNETNPKNYIGLWAYHDEAKKFNAVNHLIFRLSRIIRLKQLYNEP